MAIVRGFQELHVWQNAMDLAVAIHTATKDFPKDELYGLTSQLRRAAYSVPSNISEGQARGSSKEFRQFILIARGSLAEVQTQVLLAGRLEYLTSEQTEKLIESSYSVARQLNALMRSIASSQILKSAPRTNNQ